MPIEAIITDKITFCMLSRHGLLCDDYTFTMTTLLADRLESHQLRNYIVNGNFIVNDVKIDAIYGYCGHLLVNRPITNATASSLWYSSLTGIPLVSEDSLTRQVATKLHLTTLTISQLQVAQGVKTIKPRIINNNTKRYAI